MAVAAVLYMGTACILGGSQQGNSVHAGSGVALAASVLGNSAGFSPTEDRSSAAVQSLQ